MRLTCKCECLWFCLSGNGYGFVRLLWVKKAFVYLPVNRVKLYTDRRNKVCSSLLRAGTHSLSRVHKTRRDMRQECRLTGRLSARDASGELCFSHFHGIVVTSARWSPELWRRDIILVRDFDQRFTTGIQAKANHHCALVLNEV